MLSVGHFPRRLRGQGWGGGGTESSSGPAARTYRSGGLSEWQLGELGRPAGHSFRSAEFRLKWSYVLHRLFSRLVILLEGGGWNHNYWSASSKVFVEVCRSKKLNRSLRDKERCSFHFAANFGRPSVQTQIKKNVFNEVHPVDRFLSGKGKVTWMTINCGTVEL